MTTRFHLQLSTTSGLKPAGPTENVELYSGKQILILFFNHISLLDLVKRFSRNL